MILSRAPLRITFNGGGSDLPSFFRDHHGMCITATIDKYVYITVHHSFDGMFRIAYSKIENVDSIDQIEHPLVRNTMKFLEWDGPGLEITSVADVPSTGTGLGSSSAFTVALIRAISYLQGRYVSELECAKLAVQIEIELSKNSIGWQDQYAISVGDLVTQRFHQDCNLVETVFDDDYSKTNFVDNLNQHLLFLHVNKPRNANQILATQSSKLLNGHEAIRLTNELVVIAEHSLKAIRAHDLIRLGELLTTGWNVKSQLNGDVYDSAIQEFMNRVKDSGAYGGKLLGAGGGGFLMLICHPSELESVRSEFADLKRYGFQVKDHHEGLLDFNEKFL